MLTFSTKPWIWSFRVVVLPRTAKKCTKIYNARAAPLFFSLYPIVLRRSRYCRRSSCLNSLLLGRFAIFFVPWPAVWKPGTLYKTVAFVISERINFLIFSTLRTLSHVTCVPLIIRRHDGVRFCPWDDRSLSSFWTARCHESTGSFNYIGHRPTFW